MADKSTPPENEFAFTVRKPAPVQPSTHEEQESLLLEKLAKDGNNKEVLWDLATLYSGTGQITQALEYLRQASDKADDPEKKAYCYLLIGMSMERIRDYENAVKYYSRAYTMEPADTKAWYFINNNMGYCLNVLGKHSDAWKYCRSAIKTDPTRYNAHKNLGISCAGKGDYAEAAECFIRATRLEASDDRSLKHLEELIQQHGELTSHIPNLLSELQACRQAVELARITRNSLNSTN